MNFFTDLYTEHQIFAIFSRLIGLLKATPITPNLIERAHNLSEQNVNLRLFVTQTNRMFAFWLWKEPKIALYENELQFYGMWERIVSSIIVRRLNCFDGFWCYRHRIDPLVCSVINTDKTDSQNVRRWMFCCVLVRIISTKSVQ